MKGCPQKGQALSFGALEPATEPGPEPKGLVVEGLLELELVPPPAMEESAPEVGVEAWSAIACVAECVW